jgi:uncharacterized protein (DUF2147 family)
MKQFGLKRFGLKRFGYLAVLMVLSSSAHAGAFSFTYHGHRVRVERPRHCFSISCLSVTLPGRHGTHGGDRVDDMAAASDAAPATPATALPQSSPAPAASSSSALTPNPAPNPAPVQAKPAAAPLTTSASKQTAETVNSIPSPPPLAEPRPAAPESKLLTAEKSPADKPVDKPAATAQAAPVAPPPAKDSKQAENESADTPLGDWQTEGNKGLVRIESCGYALCGYMVDAATDAKGETILINMKPKGGSEWAGTIVSRASGNTYYAKMAMKQPNALRVEACAIGRFFCSGNDWSRIVTKPQALIIPRRIAALPPS